MRAIRWRIVDAPPARPYPAPPMATTYLDFEKPIAELATRVADLKATARTGAIDIDAEVARLEAKSNRLLRDTYARLTPWQKAQVARHPSGHISPIISPGSRPISSRLPATVRSATIRRSSAASRGSAVAVVIIGHEKGDDTASRLRHNFGMAKPEGYRKAIRLMQLADRFGLPVVTLVDTSGAFPGVQAEERGQAEAMPGRPSNAWR